MRILWISFFGSWTLPLLSKIKKGNEVGIIIPTNKRSDSFYIKDNISFYELSIMKECFSYMSITTYYKYQTIIKQFQPDIIHIHGTEKNLAQIQNFIKDIPIVISIQGLLSGYQNYTLNYLEKSKVKKYATWKNLLGYGGIQLMNNDIKKGIKYETDILQHGKYFIGRTYWDKAHILFHNPNAYYFHGEELLRDEFYQHAASWCITQCKHHSIFMPSGFNPIKGMHLAIESTHLLKQFYPDIQLTIPGIASTELKKLTNRIWGEEYIIYCINLIKKYGLENNIKLLPRLNAKEMIKEMQNAHVFLSPSSIDNSPNAVGEATMIGTPIVTTPVGGIPSILQDEKEVLFAPAGDSYMMSYQIKRIFEDNELALSLSNNAHQKALIRHNIKESVTQYLNIYAQIIKLHRL